MSTELNPKHEAILRKAAAAIRARGHDGDARLADSVEGIITSLARRASSAAAVPEGALADFAERLAASQMPLDPEFARIYHENAWDLYATDAAVPVDALPPLTNAEIHTLHRLIECAEKLDERPRPMCRDCADEDGTCPNSGLECDMRTLFDAAKTLHNKLARAAVEADRAQRPENTQQQEGRDSALRAEPASRHPIQPLGLDRNGTVRFKRNHIVDFLAKDRLNELACMDFQRDDWEQLAQLIGYSLSGFGELSYVTDETYEAAAAMWEQSEATRCRAEGGDGAPEAVDVSADRAQQGEPVACKGCDPAEGFCRFCREAERAATKAAAPADAPTMESLVDALRNAALDLLELKGDASAKLEIAGEPPLYVLVGHADGIAKLLPGAAPAPERALAQPGIPTAGEVAEDEQLRQTDGYKLGWMEGMQEGAELATHGEKTAADVEAEFADLLPGPYYMDPPDGGSVEVLEQVRRMGQDAARYRWLMRQVPANIADIFEGGSISTVDQLIDEEIEAAAAPHPPEAQPCTYPNCNCPMDAPSDPNWCARGLARPSEAKAGEDA